MSIKTLVALGLRLSRIEDWTCPAWSLHWEPSTLGLFLHEVGRQANLSFQFHLAVRLEGKFILQAQLDFLRDVNLAGTPFHFQTTRNIHRISPHVVRELLLPNGPPRSPDPRGPLFELAASARPGNK